MDDGLFVAEYQFRQVGWKAKSNPDGTVSYRWFNELAPATGEFTPLQREYFKRQAEELRRLFAPAI